jgi:hypothetical protein
MGRYLHRRMKIKLARAGFTPRMHQKIRCARTGKSSLGSGGSFDKFSKYLPPRERITCDEKSSRGSGGQASSVSPACMMQSGRRLPSSISRLRSSVFGLQSPVFGLRSPDSRLPTIKNQAYNTFLTNLKSLSLVMPFSSDKIYVYLNK